MNACSKFLHRHHIADIFADLLCSLVWFILRHKNFVFDDNSYLQARPEQPLGTKMEPRFADLLKVSVEQTFLGNSWFIDDIF